LKLEQFAASHWEARSLALAGPPDKFRNLNFDFERFVHALHIVDSGAIKASRVAASGEPTYSSIAADQAHACFDQGMTICVTGIDSALPELRRLALDTKHALGLMGRTLCNCYLSPAREGFGMHLDVQSVFLLQIEGTKRWRFGVRPSVDFPPEALDALPARRRDDFRRRHPAAPLEDPEAVQWEEHNLQPGGLLYMPAGVWHQGQAGRYSLAVTLTCCTHDLADELTALLRNRLFGETAWRRNMPAAIDRSNGRRMPPSIDAFIEERLEELRAFVQDLQPADFARDWAARVTDNEG
jgi:ribosomal protein L16 Arg81 hydroxylase